MDTRSVAFSEGPFDVRARSRLKVGVLVDLPLSPQAGGHVRCWERLAQAALGLADRLDLTVHFIGNRTEERSLGETVRYRLEPPVFSTDRLGFLSHVPDHTDLARRHPRLERWLASYDVIHTTDAYFAYARTAERVAERRRIPLTNSVHTNTPEYARLFTAQTVERLLGRGILARLLTDRLGLPGRVEQRMLDRLAAHQRRCAFALVSRPGELARTKARLAGRAGLLRRGIDRLFFNPEKRDRLWLEQRYGIPPERRVVLYAGRLNRGKNVRLLAQAVAELVDAGLDLQLVCAGDGDERAAILARLGPKTTCPGIVEGGDLARLYAAADLFAFPSRIEESANVVLEALASGLPVLVTRDGGMGREVVDGETGLVLPGGEAQPWVAAIALLAADGECRRRMSRAARRYAERAIPSWRQVLAEDLLPRWRAAALAPQGSSSAAA